jgi:hypothetical protein
MVIKQSLQITHTFILMLSLVLVPCEPASRPVVNRVDSAPPVGQTPIGEVPTDTPETAPPLSEYMNLNFGFSLSIPTGYEVQNTFIHTVFFLAPPGTQGHRERAWLNVELAGDLTSEWIAKQAQAENANLGIVITSALITIDGEPAYVLSHLPGQYLSRQVFVVHKGFLYHFTFVPDDPQEGESYQQMEALYSAALNSLHFRNDRLEVPPVISKSIMSYQLEQALEARREDDVLLMMGDEFTVLTWMDPGVTFTSYSRNEAARAIIDEYTTKSSDLEFRLEAGWPDVAGSPQAFAGFFVDEPITTVLVQGWGSQGSDEAVVIFGRRRDGSLFWRGVLLSQGAFIQ